MFRKAVLRVGLYNAHSRTHATRRGTFANNSRQRHSISSTDCLLHRPPPLPFDGVVYGDGKMLPPRHRCIADQILANEKRTQFCQRLDGDNHLH